MKVAYLVKTFPKLSETFILNEVLELERQGVELHIFSLREPSDTKVHPAVADVKARATYIPYPTPLQRVPFEKMAHKIQLLKDRRFVFLRRPLSYLQTLRFHRKHGIRKRHFDQALTLARELLRGGFKHLHAHFANEPTSVAELAHRLTGCCFSFTAHAKDIYLTDNDELARKIASAKFVITCTGFNRTYLAKLVPDQAPIHLCYHGVDLSRFSSETEADHKRFSEPPLILSVGRLCEKKGFPYLIQACHRLKQKGRRFVCRIVGWGPLQQALEEQIADLELKGCVSLVGKITQDKLIGEYRRADLFVLPCLVTDDGDRDGIPNVLVEAMAMCVPVVSTPVSGIVELVDHTQNGLLAAEKDAESLAGAIEVLLDDPSLRHRLGANGRQTVMERFSLDQSTAKVRELLVREASNRAGAEPRPGRKETAASRGLEAAPQEVSRS
jgi:glycosyltransferase involved in cell wall biosynthesis